MTSSEDAAAPPADPTPLQSTKDNMDEETKMLMHDERSCIFETRIERADLCRQRGSEQFKNGDINKAVEWYERALYHVDFDEGTWHFEFTATNRADVNVVKLPVYLNLAACYLAQGAPKDGKMDEELLSKVIENADLALAIDPENSKGLYRCGWASLLAGDVERAKEKLTKAAKHHPADKRIREAMAQLKEKLAEQKKEEKERWGGTLLDKEKEETKATTQQIKRPSESSNGLWMFAVVLIGIALALGQLSFVE